MYPLFRRSMSNLQSADINLIVSTLFLWSVFLYVIIQFSRFIKYSTNYIIQQEGTENLYQRIQNLHTIEIQNKTETSNLVELISREIVDVFFTHESDDFDLMIELKQRLSLERLAVQGASSANTPSYGFGFEGIQSKITDSRTIHVLLAVNDMVNHLHLSDSAKDFGETIRERSKLDNDIEQIIRTKFESQGIPTHIASSISQAILRL